MADEEPDTGWALPAFDPEQGLVQLRRALRDLKLSERGAGFELRGKAVVQLAVMDGAIAARVARRLAVTPEWDRLAASNASEQRKLVDEIKRRLDRWQGED
ncbi:MAG: hypothetical protein IT501_07020 [Rubrivivax sp.]|jgi:hypothetical protein|nr:hypothetical protein [Rubrivivax sp.]